MSQRPLGVCTKTIVGQEAQFKRMPLTLTLSRLTGEGTARPFCRALSF
jgi:hypothetical protein